MAKTLNVRLQQYFDSLANWNGVYNKIPLAGEVIVFNITSENEIVGATNISVPSAIRTNAIYPVHLTKTGDGVLTLAQLPWDGTPDVYSWAKSATPPVTTIYGSGSGDDTISVTVTGGPDSVEVGATHNEFLSAAYASGNTVTSVAPNSDRSQDKATKIKIPQISVNKKGHVTAAADEEVTITIPATKVAHTHCVTAAGTVSQPTFKPEAHAHETSHNLSGSLASITPRGNVSRPTFSGIAVDTSSITGTSSVASSDHTHTITPKGTVTISTGTGTANYTPSGDIEIDTHNHTVSVTNSAVSVTPSTTTVNVVSSVGAAPSFYGTESNGTLTLSWSAGSVPTTTSKTLVTGISSAELSSTACTVDNTIVTGSFTGDATQLVATFVGSNSQATGTPSKTATVASNTHTHSVTAKGTVSEPEFTGTPTGAKTVTISGTVTVEEAEATGTVSEPEFSGTPVTSATSIY